MADLQGIPGEYRGQVEVSVDFIFGDAVNAEAAKIFMSGYVVIREWPYPGYERRVLADGRVQIDLQMVESLIEGEAEWLGQRIKITETTDAKNMGTLTQIYPGLDFPAAFELRRLVSADTSIGQLYNKEPVLIHAILDKVPPVTNNAAFDGLNVFHTANSAPVPMYLAGTDIVAGYFLSTTEFREGGCSVRMISAT